MIRALRTFFMGRPFRERILVVALLVTAAIYWASSFSERAIVFYGKQKADRVALADQAQWIANRAQIESAARQAAGRFDPGRTLDGPRLLAAMSGLAHDAGLTNYTGGEPEDISSGQFAIHTLQFNITRVDWSTLKSFYLALEGRSPYIGIEECSLQADRANPYFLNVSLRVSSVEIVRQ
jgi:hypothetical protein